jgi:hypothetical protein
MCYHFSVYSRVVAIVQSGSIACCDIQDHRLVSYRIFTFLGRNTLLAFGIEYNPAFVHHSQSALNFILTDRYGRLQLHDTRAAVFFWGIESDQRSPDSFLAKRWKRSFDHA